MNSKIKSQREHKNWICVFVKNAERTAARPIRFESQDTIGKAHRLSGNNISPRYDRLLFGRLR